MENYTLMTRNQVRIKYLGKYPKKKTMELAARLEKCYCQKSPFKNYAESKLQDMLDENKDYKLEDYDRLVSHDYVEKIFINEALQTISWTQGDFEVSCAIRDLLIEDINVRECYEDTSEVDNIWIGVKVGGLLGLEDPGIFKVYKVQEDGFVGTYGLLEDGVGFKKYGMKSDFEALFTKELGE